MKLSFRILQQLIENKNKDYTIRELSKILKTDYKNTYDAIQSIKESICINKRGNASYIRYKPILTNDVYFVETSRKNTLHKKLDIVREDINAINPFVIIILFGSYAKDTQTKHSDIDLCLIHNNEDTIKQTQTRLTNNPQVELHTFHYKEFLAMIQSTQFSVGKKIVEEGIILKNIELYYALLNHG